MAQITKAHHTGLQVRSLDASIGFYRDVLGFEQVFRWNPQAPYVGDLVGYPDVDLHAAILRMPGSDTFLELLEYRNVERQAGRHEHREPGDRSRSLFCRRPRRSLPRAHRSWGRIRIQARHSDDRPQQRGSGRLHDRP